MPKKQKQITENGWVVVFENGKISSFYEDKYEANLKKKTLINLLLKVKVAPCQITYSNPYEKLQ